MTSKIVPRTPLVVRHLSSILVVLGGFAVIALVLFVVAYIVVFHDAPISTSAEGWGQFGDYFGGTLGAVLALFALIALLITLRVQAYEIHLSVQELGESAKALAQQVDTLKRQTFENTFFQLLKIHGEIVSSIDLRTGGKVTAAGRDCLRAYFKRLRASLEKVSRGDLLDVRAGVRVTYQDIFDAYESDLGHYFRHLYRIFKFIDESGIEDKRSYAGIVRAQLSADELGLLFFNGISEHGEKFRVLMERFAVLENLRPKRIPLWEELHGLYDKSAFGDAEV